MKKRHLLLAIIAVILALSLALLVACVENHDCAKDGHKYGDDGKCEYCGEAKPEEPAHDCDKDGHEYNENDLCKYCGKPDPDKVATSYADDLMQQLFDGMNTNLRNQKEVLTGPISLPAITGVFGDDGYYEAIIKWVVTGADTVSMSERDENDYCSLQCPAIREENTAFTLTGTLTDENGKVFKKADGTNYTVSKSFTLLSADSLKAAVNGFYEAAVKNPEVGKPYKWAALARYTVYYFAGETISGKTYQYKSDTDFTKAADVYLEAVDGVEGGYHIYFMDGETKTYIDTFKYGDNAGSTGFVTDESQLKGIYTIHAESGALVAKEANDTSKGYNLGIREQYIAKISAINYYLDSETGSHGWKTYEHPLLLLEEEYKLPAQPSLTAEQIMDKAYALVDGEEMSGCWSLTGTVTEKTGNSDYATVTIQVGERTIKGYGMYIYNNEAREGAVVTLTGVIKNYQDTIEFDKYCSYRLVTASPYADLEAVETKLRADYPTTILNSGKNFVISDTITVNNVAYAISWSVEGGNGQVTIDGTNVTVVKGAEKVDYRLIVVITDPNYPEKTREVTIAANVPADTTTPSAE